MSQVWWRRHLLPALRRQRKADLSEFKARLISNREFQDGVFQLHSAGWWSGCICMQELVFAFQVSSWLGALPDSIRSQGTVNKEG